MDKIYKLLEKALIEEYGEEYVSKYDSGDNAIHFYDEDSNMAYVLKVEVEP